MFGLARRTGLADDTLQSVPELACLICRQFDNEPPATFERDTHDDSAPLLGNFERTIACPRLHRRHACIPFLPRAAWGRRASLAADPPAASTSTVVDHYPVFGTLSGNDQLGDRQTGVL
jgi:hypothetical protein